MRDIDLDQVTGLSSSVASRKLKEEGYNELPSGEKRSVLRIAFSVIKEPIFLLLVASGSIYFLLGDVTEGLVLLSFVFVVMGITVYQDWHNWYNHFFLGRCFFGKFMSIAENGDAIPCSYNDVYRFGNVKNQSLQSIWEGLQKNDFFTKIRDKSYLKGKCGVCEFKDICGGCRTSALFFTGDILGSDPQCAYIPKVLREK